MDTRMKLYDLEHEKAILSALIAKPELIDTTTLSQTDLFDGKHQAIFVAIRRLVDGNKAVNYLSIAEARNGSSFSAADVSSFDLPTVGNYEYYSASVIEFAHRRALRNIGIELQESIAAQGVDELMESIDKKLSAIYDQNNNSVKRINAFLHSAVEDIQDRFNNQGKLMGVTTGFNLLDDATNGWQPGLLYIIAARPSIGKTAMALTMATAAAKAGHKVGFFSCEMSGEQLAFRLLAAESRVNISNLTSGVLHQEHFIRITNAGDTMNNLSILVDDTSNPTLSHIKGRARWMKRQGIELIFIDYLTLIKYGNVSTPRPERVGEIGKQLKQLCRELNIPIVVLSQVNREAEGREPTLANLRQSGEIEEDVDCLIFLHRERSDVATETDVIIAKQRQGPTTRFKCVFLPQYIRFENETGEKGEA